MLNLNMNKNRRVLRPVKFSEKKREIGENVSRCPTYTLARNAVAATQNGGYGVALIYVTFLFNF